MKKEELNILFHQFGKKSCDFISWASNVCYVDFMPNEISRHRRGKQGVTRSFEGLYRLYFLILEESQKAVEANPLKNLL